MWLKRCFRKKSKSTTCILLSQYKNFQCETVVATAKCDFGTSGVGHGAGATGHGSLNGVITITEYSGCADNQSKTVITGRLTVPEVSLR